MRWFEAHRPANVTLRNVSLSRVGLQIAGPRARELLQRLTRSDVSNAALPFLAVRQMEVGRCSAIVQRISYTGDLGYEIYVPLEQQVALLLAIEAAGADLQLRPFGMRAMMSLRLEKSFGSWLREYKPDFTAQETGLDRFIDYSRNSEFIGRAAVLEERERQPERRLCTFVVDADDADCWADEPIWHDDQVVGFVTSGGFAHFVERSVALGFMPCALIEDGQAVEIEILGERRAAKLTVQPLLDPQGQRMRG